MGSFVFKWEHPASDVYVTGTFDNWSKSEKLIKTGSVFEKKVDLKDAETKIFYKFVVDGNWVTDHTAPLENDHEGNQNNVLTTDRIIKHTPATAGVMSGVTPTSTTAALAKDVPKETAASSDLPGAFPETPATEPAAFSVNPIPASAGHGNPIKLAPGEKVPEPHTLTSSTITSGVHDDASLPKEQTFSVNPIPASAGIGNPISLAAGEKVPHPSTITSNSVTSNVKLDKESYEKSDAVPVLPQVVTPQKERDANGTGVLDIPPISKNLIPESSLPIGTSGVGTFDASPHIQSAGPQSTTAALAAAVPLESAKVPQVVKDSQAQAGVSPEASAVPEEVKEKSAVEKELLAEVSEAPVTSDGTTSESPVKAATGVTAGEAASAVGAAALALGGAAFAYATSAKDKAVEIAHSDDKAAYLPESVQKSISSINASSDSKQTVADTVPAPVKESIAESGKSPEAAAYTEPIAEKKAVEKELLSEIKQENSTGTPAPKAAATLAPASAKPSPESRDISPTTVPGGRKPETQAVPASVPSTTTQTQPTVTSGVGASSTTAVSAAQAATKNATSPPTTPAKAKVADVSSPASSAAASSAAQDKKKKRSSFFGKLKAKLSSKDKE